MSVAHIQTACLDGSRVLPVTVEVDIQPGLPLFSIIGLPDKRIEEAKERVRSALKNSGLGFPMGKITVNLAPSAVHKQGTGFDLAIALGICVADGKLRAPESWILGELALSGTVQPCQQLVSLLIEATKLNMPCVIPGLQTNIAQLVGHSQIVLAVHLKELATQLSNPNLSYKRFKQVPTPIIERASYSIDQIVGQEEAKRALVIAIAGAHNLMLTGPPGVGKSMLAKAAIELLPPLERAEQLTLAQLYSFADKSFSLTHLEPPLRMPHPSITQVGLLGGGKPVLPGEISLAHTGILFLDEFPELTRASREGLRMPLQEKMVEISRGGNKYHFPARCITIAAQNPCPCGLLGVSGETCRCTAADLSRYRSALSEPILDRFDLFCTLTRPSSKDWKSKKKPVGKESAEAIKMARLSLPPTVGKDARSLIHVSIDQLRLSGRAAKSLERVASTITLLEGKQTVEKAHVQEALQYRRRV